MCFNSQQARCLSFDKKKKGRSTTFSVWWTEPNQHIHYAQRIPKHLFCLCAVHRISQVLEKHNNFYFMHCSTEVFFTIAPTLVSPYTKDASLVPRLSVSNHMWIPCEEYYPVATIVHMHKLFRPIQIPAESRTSYKLQGQQGNLMSLCEWFHLSKDPHRAELRLHTLHEPAHGSRLY